MRDLHLATEPALNTGDIKRIAVAGAGKMARSRGRAFLETGRAQICAVASRRLDAAAACAAELGCDVWFDDTCRLAETRPDAILIEVPHRAQDDITRQALEDGFDVLIGGCLASDPAAGAGIVELARAGDRVVEAGYQRRYDPAWVAIRDLVATRELGEPVLAVTMALWRPDADSWYCSQQASGGMPLTHMSYCYLNAVRWILGRPVTVAAMAHRRDEVNPDFVDEETCAALIGFESGATLSATASYRGPVGMHDPEARFLFTAGGLQVGGAAAADRDAITLLPDDGAAEVRTFPREPSAAVYQAQAFLDALESRQPARNPPEDALVDVQVTSAISAAAREGRTLEL